MKDSQIVELYWNRDEAALAETQRKYGQYCYAIASSILQDPGDAEEVVNDAYHGAWNAIPPHRPAMLSTFLGKITRRLALKRLRYRSAERRGGGEVLTALEEYEEWIPDGRRIDEGMEVEELAEILNRFLASLPETERRVFLCRYWYFDSIRDIASRFGFTQSKVKVMLMRTRDKLRLRLKKEGIFV